CPNESLVGIAIYPAGNASADPQDQPFGRGGDIQVEAEGPFVAKVLVTFELQFTCFTDMQVMTGSSGFTLFPSGRIVRHDFDITPGQTTYPDRLGTCGCSTFTAGEHPSYFFTSYWAFDPNGAQMFDQNNVLVGVGSGAPGGTSACTRYNGTAGP